jgi:hypothetical protein
MNIPKDHPAILFGRITSRLNYVIEATEKILTHFHQTSMDNHVRTFCLLMLERLNFASEGIKALIPSFGENTKLEYTIGITVRSVVLDNLILMNAVNIVSASTVNDTPEDIYAKLNQFCLDRLSEGLNKTLKYIDKIKDDIGSEKLSNIYSNIFNSNQQYFDPYTYDGTRPTLKSRANSIATDLHRALKQSANLSKSATIYDAYVYYSQYDHFGGMFYTFSRLPSQDKIKMLDRAIRAFPKSLLFANVILHSVNSTDAFLAETLKLTSEFIDEVEKANPL